jgi:hypothetical protein
MMKKGLTFTSLTTGTSFTYNVPHFNSLLEAQQYLINIAVNISQIACSNVNGGVNTSLIANAFMSAIPSDVGAYISINDNTNAKSDRTCVINSWGQYVQIFKENSFTLDSDSYDLQGNVITLSDVGAGPSGLDYYNYYGYKIQIDNTVAYTNISFACAQNSNNAITPRDLHGSGHLDLLMPCTYTLTDSTLVFSVINLRSPNEFMGNYNSSTRQLVPKNASYYANYVYKLTYPIIPPRPELPSISGETTDEIDTDTGESETQDNEDNVGGDGHVTLINNVVNYDNFTPDYSRINTGFITPYEISNSELTNLHSFLYSETILDMIKNYFAGDASKAIIDLFNIPVAPTVEAASSDIKIGVISSGASANAITNETVTFDFGSIDLTANGYYSNTFMDLAPFNQYSIYLPFIGFRNLNTNDLRSINDDGFKIYLKYIIDVLTGEFVAVVEADHNNAAVDNKTGEVTTAKLTKQVINVFNGSMRTDIPLSYRNPLQGIMPIISGLAGSIGSISGTITSSANAVKKTTDIVNTSVEGLNSIGNVNNALIPRGDNISGSVGNLTLKKAFIINQEAPKYIRTGKSNQFAGYPVYKFLKLNDDRGFVKVRNVIASGFGGTAHEQERVVELLKGGVWCK